LLHVVVEFRDKQSGRPIQVAVDAAGKPLVDDKGMVQLEEAARDLISRLTSSALASREARREKSLLITTSSNLGGMTRI